MANAYVFPSDVVDNPEYGSLMIFSAYTAQSYATGPRRIQDQFLLYVPGGGENSTITWDQHHEYEPIKTSRLPAEMLGIGRGTGLAGGAFRAVINPAVEVLYRGTNLRTFDFSFIFAPQSREDALQLYGTGQNGDGILNRFRYYAAPQIGPLVIDGVTVPGTDRLIMRSPSEWEIDFLYRLPGTNGGWAVNSKIPKVAKSVIETVIVDYVPNGEFSTFETGDPVTSRLTMKFKEMEIIDKTRIAEGF
jgi:hypothetical protein